MMIGLYYSRSRIFVQEASVIPVVRVVFDSRFWRAIPHSILILVPHSHSPFSLFTDFLLFRDRLVYKKSADGSSLQGTGQICIECDAKHNIVLSPSHCFHKISVPQVLSFLNASHTCYRVPRKDHVDLTLCVRVQCASTLFAWTYPRTLT
jgi:hypothetical protein